MSRFCPLFSSSSGNCVYIGNENTHILIDSGVSCAKISAALKNIGVSISDISAVFVTHEHSDHISGLAAVLKKSGATAYMSVGTAEAFRNSGLFGSIKIIDKEVNLGSIKVERFKTSHDCDDSSGYRINCSQYSFAVCTDTGIINDDIRQHLKGCQLVMIESNHDVNMLTKGPYPFLLKQRILSDHGHLSNGACAEELPNLVASGTSRIILGHLSKHNNIPAAAKNSANAKLLSAGYTEGEDYIIYVAPPFGGKLFSF